MQSIAYINLSTLEDTFVSLTVAFVLGCVIGLERQIRQRTAGLRTNVLVCVGAALFVDIAMRFDELHHSSPGPLQVLAYVVSGIGFLGAGVIMREEGSIRGINTAATLWGSAAVGCAAGADLILEALLGACFVLAANTLLRPAVNLINRQPVNTLALEATYSISLITGTEHRQETLTLLEQSLRSSRIPLRDVDVRPLGPDEIEIEAVLLPSSINSAELDALTAKLGTTPFISQSFWNASTAD